MLDKRVLDIQLKIGKDDTKYDVDLKNGLKQLFCTIVDDMKNDIGKYKIFLDTKSKLNELFKAFHLKNLRILNVDERIDLLKIFLQSFQVQIKKIANEEKLYDRLTSEVDSKSPI